MEKDKKKPPMEESKICEHAELSEDEMGQVSGGVEPAVSGDDNSGVKTYEKFN